jgi:hypothetical protein
MSLSVPCRSGLHTIGTQGLCCHETNSRTSAGNDAYPTIDIEELGSFEIVCGSHDFVGDYDELSVEIEEMMRDGSMDIKRAGERKAERMGICSMGLFRKFDSSGGDVGGVNQPLSGLLPSTILANRRPPCDIGTLPCALLQYQSTPECPA